MYRKTFPVITVVVALAVAACSGGTGGLFNTGTQLGGAQDTVTAQAAELNRCAAPVGVAALVEPGAETLAQLQQIGLTSPVPILKLLMARSNCFQIVDRGAASEALQRERELAAQGELQEGSDMGGGQLVAADFLITPNILFQDPNAGGSNIGGILGGLLPGALGAVAGSVRSTSLEAQVLLTLTNVRSGIQQAVAEGSARKRDIGFNFGALLLGGGAGAGGVGGAYTSTDIGKIVMVAFVDGLNKLVAQIGGPVG